MARGNFWAIFSFGSQPSARILYSPLPNGNVRGMKMPMDGPDDCANPSPKGRTRCLNSRQASLIYDYVTVDWPRRDQDNTPITASMRFFMVEASKGLMM